MPIVQLNTPNLVADLVSISGIVAAVEASPSFNPFDDLINDCFRLKPTQDLQTLIIYDFTDYQELGVVDVNNVSISVYLEKKIPLGWEMIYPSQPMTPNSQLSFEGLDSDGTYCATMVIDYLTETKTLDVSYRIDYCEKVYKTTGEGIWCKMNSIACTIAKFSKIGKCVKELKKSYIRLSNLLWLYYNSENACLEKDQVLCLYNKIK